MILFGSEQVLNNAHGMFLHCSYRIFILEGQLMFSKNTDPT